MFIYDLSFFLTSTAFVPTNAKYGIPISRYSVFFENCPLGDAHIAFKIFIFNVKLIHMSFLLNTQIL